MAAIDAMEWLAVNWADIEKLYAGKWIAIRHNAVVASADKVVDLYKDKHELIHYVPSAQDKEDASTDWHERAIAAQDHVAYLLNEFAHDEACWREALKHINDIEWLTAFINGRILSIGNGLNPDGYLAQGGKNDRLPTTGRAPLRHPRGVLECDLRASGCNARTARRASGTEGRARRRESRCRHCAAIRQRTVDGIGYGSADCRGGMDFA